MYATHGYSTCDYAIFVCFGKQTHIGKGTIWKQHGVAAVFLPKIQVDHTLQARCNDSFQIQYWPEVRQGPVMMKIQKKWRLMITFKDVCWKIPT